MPTMFLKKDEDLERMFNEQLEKTGVEYFDYYLLHNLGANNYKTAQKHKAFEFIQQKKEEGKIRKIGFSYHDQAELLDKILTGHPEVDFVQLQINYLDWDSESIESGKCYKTATKHHKPVIVMEPVKGGMLADLPKKAAKKLKEYKPEMSLASWAIRFAASHENVAVVLSGMSDFSQLEDNLSYMQDFQPLSSEEENVLNIPSISLTALLQFLVPPVNTVWKAVLRIYRFQTIFPFTIQKNNPWVQPFQYRESTTIT